MVYTAEVGAATADAGRRRPGGLDWSAFTLAFKGVVLEGLEVVFIALIFGANQDDVPRAALAAALVALVVAAASVAVRAPLAALRRTR